MIPDRILRKIEACLALAGSDNPNEAATALRQAQKLMAEHGLTQLDLAAARIGEHSARARSGKTPPNYLAGLVSMVARAFGTHPIYRTVRRRCGLSLSSELIFVGPDSHARISAYAFEVLQRQLLRDRSRYEDATELPWSIVEDRLLGMMSEQTGAHLNTIDYTLKEIFTYKKRRQSIDDPQLWEPLMKEMERVRDPEAHPLQFYPPLPGDKPEPQKRPRRTQDADPPPQAALPQDDTGNTGNTGNGDNEETARLKAEIERLKAENARIAQQEVLRQRQAPAPLATLEQPYAEQEGEPRHHAAPDDLDGEADRLLGLDSSAASLERESDRGQDDPRTDEEKRASLTLSPVDEPDSKRALRHRVSEMHGGEAGDFEDFAVKAIPLMCNGPLMPITDIWWIDAYQQLRPTLRFQVFRLAQTLGQWAGFPLDGDNEDEIPILRTPKDGIGYELNPLPPHLESDPRAQRIWQLLAALQGEALQPLYPTEATLIGELLGTADVDSGAPHHPFQMPDEILVRFFRLVRLVRVLRTLPEEPEEGEE